MNSDSPNQHHAVRRAEEAEADAFADVFAGALLFVCVIVAGATGLRDTRDVTVAAGGVWLWWCLKWSANTWPTWRAARAKLLRLREKGGAK